jgi:hypothetical protein
MKWFKKFRKWISDYKTYFVCVSTILGLTVAYAEGAITLVEFYQGVMLAIAGITIAAKINRKAPA